MNRSGWRVHIAIMKKSWGLTTKILSGEKTIESRWYKNKYKPWSSISLGDTIYFKNSGEPVTLKAKVRKVVQFANLTPLKVKHLLDRYAKADGIPKKEIPNYFQRFKDKKYCLFIFLKDIQKVKPFQINKAGFGTMSAWMTVDSIKKIKA